MAGTRPLLLLTLTLATACKGDVPTEETDEPVSLASPGCETESPYIAGVQQVTFQAGPEGDGERGFSLTIPDDYDSTVPHRLVIGYAGTNWVGEQIRPYLNLESQGSTVPTIYVYPDPLWRDFPGWGNLGGWTLGPHAAPANGEGDLSFTSQILDHLESTHCVDTEQVFVTGHSWGGDMAHVAACFLGDRITAAVPVAANSPYWFDDNGSTITCPGDVAVWNLFGSADDYFTNQSYPGEIGDEGRDFWLAELGCDGAEQNTAVSFGAEGECLEYTGCDSVLRYCLYESSAGHQVPSYYSEATMGWFDSFQD